MGQRHVRATLVHVLSGLLCGTFSSVGCDWFAGPIPGGNGSGSDADTSGDSTSVLGDDVSEASAADQTSPMEDGIASGDSSAPSDGPVEGDAVTADACAACTNGCFAGVCTGPFGSISGTLGSLSMGARQFLSSIRPPTGFRPVAVPHRTRATSR